MRLSGTGTSSLLKQMRSSRHVWGKIDVLPPAVSHHEFKQIALSFLNHNTLCRLFLGQCTFMLPFLRAIYKMTYYPGMRKVKENVVKLQALDDKFSLCLLWDQAACGQLAS